MIGFGEAMLDAVALAGAAEDVSDPGLRYPLIAIGELDAPFDCLPRQALRTGLSVRMVWIL
jgi:hypothetical protein